MQASEVVADRIPESLRSRPPETPAPRTHSPTTRRPSGSRTSTFSTSVPASDGPKESMIRSTIRRDAHNPHARSGGSTALICRSVKPLTVAAARDRREPRVGIVLVVTTGSTTVIGDICQCQHLRVGNLAHTGDGGSGQRSGSPRQWKLLTYLPMSRAICRFAADGFPEPKSGPNAWYGPTAPATKARSFLTATMTTTRIRV